MRRDQSSAHSGLAFKPGQSRINRAVGDVGQADLAEPLDEFVAVRLALREHLKEEQRQNALQELWIVGWCHMNRVHQVPCFVK
jgi:hypothetical protein